MGEVERILAAYRRRAAAGKGARYSPFRRDALLAAQHVERALLAALRRNGIHSLAGKKVLDVGCGTGRQLQRMIDYGAQPQDLAGIDLRPDAVELGRRLNPGIDIRQGNAEELPFGDASFDIVAQFTVFTSILDPQMRVRVAAEMARVLRPEGVIIWYDYLLNNPRNPDVRGVGKSAIRRLFPGFRIDLRRVVLAPPLARVVAPVSMTAAILLSVVPWLCTHYLGVIRKPENNASE